MGKNHDQKLCKTCTMWLIMCMREPLRCGGLSYNDDGNKVTRTGKLWSEVVAEHEVKRAKERLEYFEKHQEHLEKYRRGDYTDYMSSKKKKEYKTYLEFLEARINSENYKKRVSEEEYEKTLAKYKKEKLIRKLLNK